jgi:retron-type reverse transcriptase
VNSIDWHYAYYTIRKKRGGKRRIVVPHENLKNIQRWILMEILEKSSVNSACKGFVKQRGIVDNAKPHVGKKFIRKFDLKDFFESIDVRRIYGIFHELGYSEAVSHDLATLCTIKISDQRYDNLDENKKMLLRNLHEIQYPVLAQGAPTSPMLANLVCRSLDARFAKYSSLNGVSYTRYADDLTFSADDITKLPSKSFVRRVVEEEGLKLNNSKTGTYGRDRRQMVTGILIDGDHMHLPQKYKRQITRHLHFCEKYGAKKHFNHIMPGKGNYKEWLYGKIYFLYAVEPNTAKALLEIANNIDWGLL